jgi:uncharacterized protein (TIGR02147 family)
MTIFAFDKYRELLIYQIEKSGNTRGYKSLLAAAAGSQSSHISQVLHGSTHLTIEQAHGMSRFWHFDADATAFFIALVQRERSTNREFSEYLTGEIQKIRSRKTRLSETIKSKPVPASPADSRYYASWIYPVVHMLVTIPKYQNVRSIVDKLKVSKDAVEKAVFDLENMGLLKRDGSTVVATDKNIHINSDSPWNISYHNIWRNLANQKMQLDPSHRGVHFTTLYSLSEADYKKLREMVLGFIHATRDVVLPSPEEKIVCFACDLFEI